MSQISVSLQGTDSELSAISCLLCLAFKVWWDFSADLSLKFGPSLLCLDKNYQWWLQLSLTLGKVIFSCLPVLATHTFSPWALQNFLCSAGCQLWSLISTGVVRWFAAQHRFKIKSVKKLHGGCCFCWCFSFIITAFVSVTALALQARTLKTCPSHRLYNARGDWDVLSLEGGWEKTRVL